VAVLRELVDARCRGRRQLALRDDAGGLEVAEAIRQDVRADSGELLDEVGVPLGAVHELQYDEKAPPFSDEPERVGDRAVTVVALAHTASVAGLLALVKHLLAIHK